MLSGFKKRGQVTVFIIIALVIVAGIVVYFVVRDNTSSAKIPKELAPVFEKYLSCLEDETNAAASMAGTQGGHIYVDDYVPGSEFAPFSSELNFLGYPVPYWYYIAGNGIIKENVPTKTTIQNEIKRYIEENVNNCDFEDYYSKGYALDIGGPDATVVMNDGDISVTLNNPITVSSENASATKKEYKVVVQTKLGKYYALAREIYDKEKKEAFLENYTIDVLRLYAPVDGVELSCSPKIWKTQEVVDELRKGLEGNIGALTMGQKTGTAREKYFTVEGNVDENVRFLYSPNWPSKFEIYGEGVDQDLMIAEPVGNEQGMGIMGFCYAPYHYVYDISYPVMVQIYDNKDVFQFPVAIIIDKNVPRRAVFSENTEGEIFNLCQYNTQPVTVSLYDVNLNPVDGDVYYSCFNQRCRLGETENGIFNGNAPACMNGYIEARAEGYAQQKQLMSTNEESESDFILDKEYEMNVNVEVSGSALKGTAVAIFDGNQVRSIALPATSKMKLAEGLYNLTVYVYGNSSITIPESTKTECVNIAKKGISGLFGATEEKCFEIKLPATKIESALIGGGKASVYILPEQLQSGKLMLKVDSLPTPKSMDELAQNYVLFDDMGVEVE